MESFGSTLFSVFAATGASLPRSRSRCLQRRRGGGGGGEDKENERGRPQEVQVFTGATRGCKIEEGQGRGQPGVSCRSSTNGVPAPILTRFRIEFEKCPNLSVQIYIPLHSACILSSSSLFTLFKSLHRFFISSLVAVFLSSFLHLDNRNS